MKPTGRESQGRANGVAALAILKMLLDVMNKKDLITEEEIDIILNCAEIDVQNNGDGLPSEEARALIENLLSDEDPVTTIV